MYTEKPIPMDHEALVAEFRRLGVTQSAIAIAMRVTVSALNQWQLVPADRVLALAKACQWRIFPHQLRPDIYPNPLDAIPPELVAELAGQWPYVEKRASTARRKIGGRGRRASNGTP